MNAIIYERLNSRWSSKIYISWQLSPYSEWDPSSDFLSDWIDRGSKIKRNKIIELKIEDKNEE